MLSIGGKGRGQIWNDILGGYCNDPVRDDDLGKGGIGELSRRVSILVYL
jgi:hypothetical protein